jgi:hypothetical protein
MYVATGKTGNCPFLLSMPLCDFVPNMVKKNIEVLYATTSQIKVAQKIKCIII